MTQTPGRCRNFLVNVLAFKLLPLLLAVIPTHAFVGWLGTPESSRTFFRSLIAISGIACLYLYPDLSACKVAAGPFFTFLFCEILAQLEYLPILTWVYMSCILLVVISILCSLMSAFIGQKRSPHMQEFCLAIALGIPLVTMVLFLLSGSYFVFQLGVVVSISASSINVLWNKTEGSVGVPN